MPEDIISNFDHARSDPATRCFAIAPNDSADLALTTKAIYVGTAGNIALRAVGDSADVTFSNVPAGAVLPVRATHVRATLTTAGDLVGLA